MYLQYCVGQVLNCSLFWGVTVKLLKWSSSFLFDVMLTLSSMSLPFPPLGNDLEALQIHLCFCRSNLHPRRTAKSGSTLVSAVSNIYLSQQTGGGETRKLLETSDGTISWPLAHCLQSPALWRGFETDWICLPFASRSSSTSQCTRRTITTSFDSSIYLPVVFFFFWAVIYLCAVDQCFIFLGFIFTYALSF